jgi:hypothetical protein
MSEKVTVLDRTLGVKPSEANVGTPPVLGPDVMLSESGILVPGVNTESIAVESIIDANPAEIVTGPDLAAESGELGASIPEPFNLESAVEVLSPQEAQEVQQETVVDATNRYTDTELLGKSFRVRRLVQEASTQTIRGWRHIRAKVRNAFDTPGKIVKSFAYRRAENSHTRKSARLENAKSERLLDIVAKSKATLDRRSQTLSTHTDQMERRFSSVNESADQRRQDYIDQLKVRRQDAVSRKAVREHLRSEGATRSERRRITNELFTTLPTENIDKLGKAAIIAETTHRKVERAARTEGRAVSRQRRTRGQIRSTEGRIDTYDQTIYDSDQSAVELSTDILPKAKAHAAQLRDKLASLAPSDVGHEPIMAELQLAEADVSQHERELQHWRDVSHKTRNKANKADGRLGGLGEKHDNRKQAAEDAAAVRARWNSTSDQDQGKLHQKLDSILNPKESEENE